MKLENQVCSLEQAKKLKELGVGQYKSLFRWCVFCPDPTGESYFYEVVYGDGVESAIPGEFIADAYSVAELGVMLPSRYNAERGQDGCNDKWWCMDDSEEIYLEGMDSIGYDTQAQCLADLLIHLLEIEQTTVTDCNNRLKNA